MGLNVTVGVWADRLSRDKDAAASIENELRAVNAALKKAGLKRHKEPKKAQTWTAEAHGHTGLHALRDVAARLAAKEDLPRDRQIEGNETLAAERHFADILELVLDPPKPGVLGRLFGGGRAKLPDFAHLSFHSASAGYYVPVDFKVPLVPHDTAEGTKHIWPLGSSNRLADETKRLAKALEVPSGMTYDDDDDLRRWREGQDETAIRALAGASHRHAYLSPSAGGGPPVTQDARRHSLRIGRCRSA